MTLSIYWRFCRCRPLVNFSEREVYLERTFRTLSSFNSSSSNSLISFSNDFGISLFTDTMRGISKVTIVPSPSSDTRLMLPPSASIHFLLTVSPIPQPFGLIPAFWGSIPNNWNNLFWSSCLMPMPVSETLNSINRLFCLQFRPTQMLILPPELLNLNEFDTKFRRTCLMRVESEIATIEFKIGSMLVDNSIRLCSHWFSKI